MDHPDSKIIDAAGGNARLAEMFSVSSQAISQWRLNGIPEARVMYLRLVRRDIDWDARERAVKRYLSRLRK